MQNYRPVQHTARPPPNPNLTPTREKDRDIPPTPGTEVFFLQANQTDTGLPILGTDGKVHADIRCYNCQRMGHYAGSCPTATGERTNVQLVQVEQPHGDNPSYELSFVQVQKEDSFTSFICKHWLLLDSQSSISVFKNKDLVTNVRNSYLPVKVHTNGGQQESHKFGNTDFFERFDTIQNLW